MENSGEKFGDYLKAQREKKGIRLEEIASITKIHLHSLELLESSQWDALPPEPFIRGFIIAYAKYVGLESKETITRYNEEVRVREAAMAPQTPAATPESTETASEVIEHTRSLPLGKIAMAGGASAFVFLVAVLIYVGKRADKPEAGRVTTTQPTEATAPTEGTPSDNRGVAANQAPTASKDATPGTPDTTTTKTDPAAVAPVGATEDYTHELVVEGQDRTWMKVVVDDKPPMELFLPKGQKGVYRAKTKIKLVLGNANGAVVTHNGEQTKGQKYEGTIRFYIFPVGSRFPQDKGARKVAKEKPAAITEGSESAPPTATETADE